MFKYMGLGTDNLIIGNQETGYYDLLGVRFYITFDYTLNNYLSKERYLPARG